ncbi:MAG: methyltransferase domain-containing protein [Pseudonocardiaceae bacterium]
MSAETDWRALLGEVPRDGFIPDLIWVDAAAEVGGQSGFVALCKGDDPGRWWGLVAGDEPVVTQVDEGNTAPGQVGWSPSSSCSKPSIVAAMLDVLDVGPGQSVLEIGTGTGWNAALLSRRVGESGRVVSIEVDPGIAQRARSALVRAGYASLVVCADGVEGYRDAAPYDRVLATASVREVVPRTWLEQTRPGGLVVTPWGTDYCNGVMLTVQVGEGGAATGRFGGDLAFMRLRSQRRRFYEPDQAQIDQADVATTEVHGWDFFRMINSDQAAFSIGLLVPRCALTVELNTAGEDHHILELDDVSTGSWARLDADLCSSERLVVRQLGPRRLWDEAETAYDWWYERGKPGLDRFGMTITTPGDQTVWVDDPSTIVRDFTQSPGGTSPAPGHCTATTPGPPTRSTRPAPTHPS